MGISSKAIGLVGFTVLTASLAAAIGFELGQPAQISTARMLDSSVSIKTISHVRTDRFGDSVWEPTFGSGFLVSAQPCEVWTNHHVIKDAALIRVFPRGADLGEGLQARVVHATPRPDIAVLRLEHCNGIALAELGDSKRVETGMEAYAVGNPLGSNPDSVSRGIISHTTRHVGTNTYLQTDASINPGNSGGALFDRDGRVIGMSVSLISMRKGGGNTGIGYAIPVNRVVGAVRRLESRAPGWGTGGFADLASNLTAAEAAVFKVPNKRPAIILTKTPEGGPGAGLLMARDVVYRVDGEAIVDVEHLRRLFAEREPGSEVALDLVRGGKPVRTTLKLADGYTGDEPPAAQPYEGLLGMTLEMWDQREGEQARFTKPVITQVQSLGPAHIAEISSSQHSVAFNGAKFVAFLLDVKTVTGVVLDGQYHPTLDIASVRNFAADAHARSVPLLLEIEHWARKDPRNARTDLVHRGTAFFKVDPTPGATLAQPTRSESGFEAVSTIAPVQPRSARGPI